MSFKQEIIEWHKRWKYWSSERAKIYPNSEGKAKACREELDKILSKCSKSMRKWCEENGYI